MSQSKRPAAVWHAVPRELLEGGGAPPASLYLRLDGRYALYYHPGSMNWDEAQQRLREKHVKTLWVPDDQLHAFREHIAGQLQRLAADESQPPAQRGRLVYHACYQALQESFAKVDNYTAFLQAKITSIEAVSAVLDHPEILPGVGLLIGHHYDTFSHSVQVSALSITLAQHIGIKDRGELVSLGLGGMFHDLGKVRIPRLMLEKNGPLTAAEWKLIHQHPRWGQSLLTGFNEGDVAREPVLQHHERFDGGGYPDGLSGEEIALSARITKVADVFNALTSRRAYRDPLTAFGALSLMRTQMSDHFDSHVLAEFIHLLGTVAKQMPQPDDRAA